MKPKVRIKFLFDRDLDTWAHTSNYEYTWYLIITSMYTYIWEPNFEKEFKQILQSFFGEN